MMTLYLGLGIVMGALGAFWIVYALRGAVPGSLLFFGLVLLGVGSGFLHQAVTPRGPTATAVAALLLVCVLWAARMQVWWILGERRQQEHRPTKPTAR